MLKIHVRGEASYASTLNALSNRGDDDLERVEPAVRKILDGVRAKGDDALRAFAKEFEQRDQGPVAIADWRERAESVAVEVREALAEAGERVRRYHEHQREPGFRYEEEGIELGQRVRAIPSVGVYAPGGKARYPSSVLMAAIPAAVAGVPRIVLASPNPPPVVLAAAVVAGVTEVIDVGGAQAVGAMAFGTESVHRVDKIVGPGNIYVACAKRLVFGRVDIDSIAGPSEILVVADETADPGTIAADLLSQAEHDEDAYPLLITLERSMAERVNVALEEQLVSLPKERMARASLENHGDCFVVGDRDEAARVATELASEHLALAVDEPDALFEQIGAAGAVFLGHHTPEAAGDYAAGPSHVLPTGGSARFASPLGVYDFLVRSSIVKYSKEAIIAQADLLEGLARLEGLEAHARAVSRRR